MPVRLRLTATRQERGATNRGGLNAVIQDREVESEADSQKFVELVSFVRACEKAVKGGATKMPFLGFF